MTATKAETLVRHLARLILHSSLHEVIINVFEFLSVRYAHCRSQRNCSPSELFSRFALRTDARCAVDTNIEIWSLINEFKGDKTMIPAANKSLNVWVYVFQKNPRIDMKVQWSAYPVGRTASTSCPKNNFLMQTIYFGLKTTFQYSLLTMAKCRLQRNT